LGNQPDDVCVHCRVLQKINQDVMELCVISPRMTVTVAKLGMNGNGLVKVKWGCCRGRNRVNQGGKDCPERNNRML